MAFQGTFDFTLDAKNRLTVPSKLRPTFADGLVLAAGLEPCVCIWRPADYDEYRDRTLGGVNPLSREYRALQRFFSSQSDRFELDGAGRVMIPSFLLQHAGLDREVSLIGAGDCMEVWDRGRWAETARDITSNIADIAAGLGG